jgi:beta-fructofuranosidase
LNESWANVVKTAAFKNDRRIAAAWIPSRSENKDNNGEIFGGNTIFREITQSEDGTLNTKFPAEMIPETGQALPLKINASLYARLFNGNEVQINSPDGVGAAFASNIPGKCRITLEIEPQGITEEYGLLLRSDEKGTIGYRLNFSANTQIVSLGNTNIKAVRGLHKPVKVDIILYDDIIDVCIGEKRCIVNRTPEQKGSLVWFYAKHGSVIFKSIKVNPITENN